VRAFTARSLERGAPTAAALGASLDWLRDTDLRADAPRLPQGTLICTAGVTCWPPSGPAAGSRGRARGAHRRVPDAAHLPFFTTAKRSSHALESAVA
jgi:hypothetical protein